MAKLRFRGAVLCALVLLAAMPVAHAQDNRVFVYTFDGAERTLTVEILADDLVHFELAAHGTGGAPIWTSPMVAQAVFDGPTAVSQPAPNVVETAALRVEVDEASLCVTLTDIARTPELTLTTTCPLADKNGLTMTKEGTTDIYGLGEQFQRRGGADGNWAGKRRVTLNFYGNALEKFEGGNVEAAQFPVMYALGAGTDGYALFLDDVYQQYWNFTGDPFSVETKNDAVRWYVMSGPDLPDLRADYLELTGRPPVPPKAMFGLWVSEYGYEDWAEMQGVIDSMRAAGFPMDGLVMDLQWFGGIGAPSHMGALDWDTANFPDPAANIARLRADYGLGVMPIEEPYVDQSTPDYAELAADGVLVGQCAESTCAPVVMDAWWGKGGMVDFTDPDAAARWHDSRRSALGALGVVGHWTDLGEPENYVESAHYYGFPELDRHGQADVHNVYNLLWSKSIFDGIRRDDPARRPFVMSRSGTSGSQRFGVAMWSGDIGTSMNSLATQFNVQMHMSLSGVDYFGSDIGGFYRLNADPVLKQDGMYTLWLANSVLTDVPVRPHTSNPNNAFQTAPSLIGDTASNLANVRLRYALSPYLYTLAHHAYTDGTAIFPPLVYAFQTDPVVRTMGGQKMIGDALMMATVSGYPQDTIPVYLPAGGWFNTLDGTFTASAGQTVDAPIRADGLLRAPLFARDGAIVPQMPVDEATLNLLGQRTDGTFATGLIVTVYAQDAASGSFTLIEDDGVTNAYQDGAVRETPLSFVRTANGIAVTVGAAAGTYAGAPDARQITVRLVTGSGTQAQTADVTASEGWTFAFE